MAKHFIDTEFIEHAGGIQLVSIGIYSENGKSLYIESTSFDSRLANDWVKKNVLEKLLYVSPTAVAYPEYSMVSWTVGEVNMYGCCSEAEMGKCILEFLKDDQNPEFYAYYGAYDWVVFARIFGRMIDLPEHFPMWVIDLKQMMWERGLTKEWKQEVCPDPVGEHNALVDAKWNYDLFREITKYSINSTELLKDLSDYSFKLQEQIKAMELDAAQYLPNSPRWENGHWCPPTCQSTKLPIL